MSTATCTACGRVSSKAPVMVTPSDYYRWACPKIYRIRLDFYTKCLLQKYVNMLRYNVITISLKKKMCDRFVSL